MGYFAIGWWLAPLVLFGLAALAVRTIWVTLTVPRRVTAPACERCRYPVSGLSSFQCPECGTDLRVTGIVTRPMEMRRRGGVFVAILSWTYLIGSGTLLVEGIAAASLMSMAVGAGGGGSTVQTSVMTPNSKAYATVAVAQTSAWGSGLPTSQIDLTLRATDGKQRTLHVDSVGNRWEIVDDSETVVASGASFDDEAIAALYEAAGVDTSDPQVGAEARELVRVVDVALVANWTAPLQMNLKEFVVGQPTWSGTTAAPAVSGGVVTGVVMVGMLAAAAVVYIVGLVWGVLRRRRLMAEVCEAVQPAPVRANPPVAPRSAPHHGEGSRVRGGQPLGPLEWGDEPQEAAGAGDREDPQAN